MSRAQKKILFIEDDRETAALIAEGLVDCGFVVGVTYDAREGVAAIQRQSPDLVLCDISMPYMSGFDVFERLSEVAPEHARLPFVFLTALSDRETELKAWQLGVDDYVTKPVDFDILAAIIKARIARSPRDAIEPEPNPADLNQREAETLTWVSRGRTSAEIAKILGLTKRTVDFHIDNARIKLGAQNRAQAVLKASKLRLIKP